MNEHGDYLLFVGIFGLISVIICIGLIDLVSDFPRLALLYVFPWGVMTAGGIVINKRDRHHKHYRHE